MSTGLTRKMRLIFSNYILSFKVVRLAKFLGETQNSKGFTNPDFNTI